mgnify:CR=1 FL=1
MKKRLPILTLLALAMALGQGGKARAADSGQGRFVDLSLIVAENYPCTWATGFPRFYMNRYIRIGPSSPYNSDLLQIDGNTGTQIDVPPHSIPRPGSGLKNAGPLGLEYTDRTPAWKLVGEACVIDVTALLDQAPNGVSPLVKKEHIIAWEKKHRPLGQGDIVLLWSGYSDKYYRPMPEGRRFLALPLEKKTPAWPDPDPECMAYMAKKGVTAVGCDSPTMGPMPDLAAAVHDEGLLRGLVFTEGATNLRKLPPTGAFYCMMGPRHFEGPYGEGRAFAIVGGQADFLIKSARAKRVADLSVVMAANHPLTWPGRGVSRHRHPYARADFFYEPALDIFHHTHLMDSHAGTSLVPPAYALPKPGFKNSSYSPEVRGWLKEYETNLESTKKHFKESQSLSAVELKEFSLLYLILNNLNMLNENIHLIENIKLFTEVNKKIFETIIKKLKSDDQIRIEDLQLDKQWMEKINKFAPIKHILKNQSEDKYKIMELLDDISRDLLNYDLEFRIQELESKFSIDMSETTFNELKELKKKQNLN